MYVQGFDLLTLWRLIFMNSIYDITLMTYLIAFGHFTSELLIFRTARVNVAFMSPCIVASKSSPKMKSSLSRGPLSQQPP